MSQAEYFSKPLPVLSKLADVLRQFPAVQSMFARIAALWRGNKRRAEPRAGDVAVGPPAVAERAVERVAVVPEPPVVSESVADPVAVVLEPPVVSESTLERVAVVLEPPAVTENAVDPVAVVAEQPVAAAVAMPQTDPKSARQELIRRRWAETGIKMWNPDVHGAGKAALSIQGGAALLPPKQGETLPRYDRLEFRMVRSEVEGQDQILCEGVVLDPPKRRAGR
jgi:hypothetical protein